MKIVLIPLLALGLASAAFAGESCGSGSCDKAQAPACKCGAKTADECHKHCADKCDCTTHHDSAPKPETKK
ncbi:MAG: hypothetical protein QM691_18055 [Opitutaceae bacterium]